MNSMKRQKDRTLKDEESSHPNSPSPITVRQDSSSRRPSPASRPCRRLGTQAGGRGEGRETRHRHSGGAREPADQLPLKPGRGGQCGRRLAESPWHCTQPAVARLGSPRPRTRSRKAAAQCRPSTDSPRCDPGRAGVGLWRTLRTRGRRPRALTDEFAANRRLPATERIAPQGRRGRRSWAAGDKARGGRGVDGGWGQTRPAWEPLRCPNGPGRAALAQPSPAIGSETRNGTDRAGRAPRTVCSQPRLRPWVTCPRLACARPCPPPRSSLAGFPACRPWLFF